MKWYKIKTLPEDTLCSHSHSLGSDLRYVITPSNNNSNLRHWASLVSQLVKNPPATQETPDRFLDREDPLKKGQVSRSRTPGFPSWLRGWRICLQRGRPGFYPWVGKIPWRRKRLPFLVFWPRKFHGLYSPWGLKELDMTEQLSLTHSKLIWSSH